VTITTSLASSAVATEKSPEKNAHPVVIRRVVLAMFTSTPVLKPVPSPLKRIQSVHPHPIIIASLLLLRNATAINPFLYTYKYNMQI
jgi:hypothetical protein